MAVIKLTSFKQNGVLAKPGTLVAYNDRARSLSRDSGSHTELFKLVFRMKKPEPVIKLVRKHYSFMLWR